MAGVLQYAKQYDQWDFWWDRWYHVNFYQTHPMDAMIAEVRDPKKIQRYRRLKMPVVAVTGIEAAGRLPLITANNLLAGELAANYLLQLGFDQLALVAYPRKSQDLRIQGFLATAAQHDVPVSTYPVPAEWLSMSVASRMKSLHRWLLAIPKPIGLFARDDLVAVDLATASHQMPRVRIPEDVAILGSGNNELLCSLCHPPLSSVDLASFQMGFQAAARLDRIFHGEPASLEPVFLEPAGVVTRQSTNTLAIRDPDVVKALQLIRQEACLGMNVADLLTRVNVCRTSLEMRFRRILGRSVHQELVRVRLQEAQRLLRTTELAMPEITDRCGFSYPSQLSHIFKRELGVSPRQYRLNMRVQH